MDLAYSLIKLYEYRDRARNSIDKKHYTKLCMLIRDTELILPIKALSEIKTFYEYGKLNPITDEIREEFEVKYKWFYSR